MSTLRQRAINGDVAAINDLIYAQLGGQGLLVTVQKDAARCLTIRLQGEAVPDPTVYQDYIIDGLQQLRPLDIQSIRVVGEAFDPAVSPETPWEARVPIAKPRRFCAISYKIRALQVHLVRGRLGPVLAGE